MGQARHVAAGYQIRIAYNLNLNLDTQSGPLVAAFSVTANQS